MRAMRARKAGRPAELEIEFSVTVQTVDFEDDGGDDVDPEVLDLFRDDARRFSHFPLGRSANGGRAKPRQPNKIEPWYRGGHRRET